MRLVSILGDSLSTYEGYNPPDYSVFYDSYIAQRNGLITVYDTWWAKVNQYLHAYLCVNNSYSGCRVVGKTFPSANSEKRACSLHTDQYTPNIILIYIGFNDFADGAAITSNEADGSSFFESYYHMLAKIKNFYPGCRIICATLMTTTIKNNPSWDFPHKWAGTSFYEYNAAIKIASSLLDLELADLAALNISYETLDGTHPTKEGHNTIAQAWISCLQDLGNF